MDSDYFSSIFEQATTNGLATGAVIAFAVAAVLLVISGFVSASESAFSSLSPNDIDSIREGKLSSGHRILYLLNRSEYLSAAILITNNFANAAIVMLCAYGINTWIDLFSVPVAGLIAGAVLFAFLLLLFGEIIPKIYARKAPLRFIRFAAPALKSIEYLNRPLSKLLVASPARISKSALQKKHDLSAGELSKALELNSPDIQEEKEMLAEIIKFYNKTAGEIMTSRLDMADIEVKSGFRGVLDFIIKSGYSRIPVYADTEDNIKGIIYIKDLLPYTEQLDAFEWQSLIRPAYFVPESKKIDDLLEEFQANKIHMAVVIDEFGGTSGIVTLEDILEEIVGDISDEYDEDEKQYVKLADGSIIFEAKILLNDFFRITETSEADFGRLTEGVETLAGLLLEIKGDFPQRREAIVYEDFRFQVLEVDKRRIRKVKFGRQTEAGMEEESK